MGGRGRAGRREAGKEVACLWEFIEKNEPGKDTEEYL
jgi:hypothetical protein